MGSPSSPKIIELRRMLQEQSHARAGTAPTFWQSGDAQLDALQIPKAALTEIVTDPFRASGGSLLLHRLLQLTLSQQRVVLIDAKDSFDPQGLSPALLNRLLWLRCPDASLALKTADLILRDGNISFALLLCLLNPERELKKIPSQSWHRLQLLTEKSAITFLVFTPFPLIGSARLRVSVESSFSLADLDLNQNELRQHLHLAETKRRQGLSFPSAADVAYA